jgi:hypothetical protein
VSAAPLLIIAFERKAGEAPMGEANSNSPV